MRFWLLLAMLASCKATTPLVVAIDTVEPHIMVPGKQVPLLISSTSLGGPTFSKTLKPTLFFERRQDINGAPVTGPAVSTPVDVVVSPGRETLYLSLQLDTSAPAGIYAVRLLQTNGDTFERADAIVVLPPAVLSGLSQPGLCTDGVSEIPIAAQGRALPLVDGKGLTAQVTNGLAPADFGAYT